MLADFGIRSTSGPKRIKKSVKNAEQEIAKQSSAILSMLEETSGIKIPPLSQPAKGKAPEFKFEDRPLNSQETTGLFALAGIIGGGLLLGTLGSGTKQTKPEKEQEQSSKQH